MVGGAVALAMALWPGIDMMAAHPWAIAWFGLMGSLMLSLMGLLTSLWAEKFDHAAAVTNFVVAPLSLLSGTFYVIDNLAPAFQAISRANPFFYMISGFRFGFIGESDIGNTNGAVIGAALGAAALNLVLGWLTYRCSRAAGRSRADVGWQAPACASAAAALSASACGAGGIGRRRSPRTAATRSGGRSGRRCPSSSRFCWLT
jgi:ABC-2 type transport system permease protein